MNVSYFVVEARRDAAVMGPLDYIAALSAAQSMNAGWTAIKDSPRFTVEKVRTE